MSTNSQLCSHCHRFCDCPRISAESIASFRSKFSLPLIHQVECNLKKSIGVIYYGKIDYQRLVRSLSNTPLSWLSCEDLRSLVIGEYRRRSNLGMNLGVFRLG